MRIHGQRTATCFASSRPTVRPGMVMSVRRISICSALEEHQGVVGGREGDKRHPELLDEHDIEVSHQRLVLDNDEGPVTRGG